LEFGRNFFAKKFPPCPIGANFREVWHVISGAYHPPPSPSHRGRGVLKPSPLAGEGRVRGLSARPLLPKVSAYAPRPLSRNSCHLRLADFLGEEIDKPEHIEKFLERGLGRNLFSKRFSPYYFLEIASA
jgi:hypothetical protein